ncbi:hypothetical protein Bca52824_064044 [Brassica carinata]|uniref:Uncharacterized protein n=1 Tax=Brassica carinata TaxID=52824 RepID=A0A8X7U8Q7_BRACI|nr:hypothetical protein Bca52824_064044 [Brassica carinata]
MSHTHIPVSPGPPQAFISIWGEGAEEKALELNGSDMGGFKLVVVSCEQPVENCPRPVDDAFPRGYMILDSCSVCQPQEDEPLQDEEEEGQP